MSKATLSRSRHSKYIYIYIYKPLR